MSRVHDIGQAAVTRCCSPGGSPRPVHGRSARSTPARTLPPTDRIVGRLAITTVGAKKHPPASGRSRPTADHRGPVRSRLRYNSPLDRAAVPTRAGRAWCWRRADRRDQALESAHDLLDQAIDARLGNDQPRADTAPLPWFVVIDAEIIAATASRSTSSSMTDVRRLAAALRQHGLHVRLCGVAQHQLADLARSSEAHHVHTVVQAERFAHDLAFAEHDVERARRQPRFDR